MGALWYVARPAGHVPLYDANLVRLAESDLQGYCAGTTLWDTGGAGDAAAAARCRSSEAAKTRSNSPNASAVPRAFCQALVDKGWREGTIRVCLEVLVTNKYWPTYDGSISDQWNRARPYPLKVLVTPGKIEPESRTGQHQEQRRDEDPRAQRGYDVRGE